MNNQNDFVLPQIASMGAGEFKTGEPPKGAASACKIPSNGQAGQFLVPTGSDPVSLAVRCHEYGHLALEAQGRVSMAQLEPVVKASDNLIAQSIFDVLVNAHLVKNGLDEELANLPFPNYCNIKEIDYTTYLRALGIVSNRKYPQVLTREDKEALAGYRQEIVSLLDKSGVSLGLLSPLKQGLIDTDALVDIAKRLKEQFGTAPPSPEGEGEGDREGDGESGEEGESSGESSEGDSESSGEPKESTKESKSESKASKKTPLRPKPIPKAIKSMMAGKRPEYITRVKKSSVPKGGEVKYTPMYGDPFEIGQANGERGQWGKMQIDFHKLDKVVLCQEKRARKARPGFVGALRYPMRALLPAYDGSAFGQKKRSAGGTMLVDLSGSMSISPEQIQTLVRKAPHVKIAMYCSPGRDSGSLVILAQRGRQVENIEATRVGGANVVDGPALEWLSKQATPRIWISDGQVTGSHESQSVDLTRWATKLKKLGRIKQYKSIKDYIANKPVMGDGIK